MYGLGPVARKRQQMLIQRNKSPNQRQTRQLDQQKHRQTFNSRNEKLLNVDQDLAVKKKQKLQNNNISNNINISSNNSSENNDSYSTTNKDPSDMAGVTNTTNSDNVANSEEDYDSDGNMGDNSGNQKLLVKQGILGDGHLQLLHAYVRETLFKNIKILSPTHLETNGEIMQEILRIMKYSEAKNGSLSYFTTACRIEIRKTMCSRRGYVKRQTGITVAGKINYVRII